MSVFWNFVQTLTAGTLAKAEDMNTNFSGIDTGLDLVEAEINKCLQITNSPGVVDIVLNAAARANKLVEFDVNGDIAATTIMGDWNGDHADAAGTDYQIRDVVKDAAGSLGLNNLYICNTTHTSTGSLSTDTANWDLLMDAAVVAAAQVTIADAGALITATTVEGALQEVFTDIANLTGSDIANTPAGDIAATDVQAAIDELDTEKMKIIDTPVTGDLILQAADGELSKAGYALPNINADVTASDEELNFSVGVTSAIQTQLDAIGFSSGTWTPTLQDLSASDAEGQTYALQYGSYTKIGSRIIFSGHIYVTSIGTLSTSVHIAGLPYPGKNTVGGMHAVAIGDANSLNITAGYSVTGRISVGSSVIILYLWDDVGGTTVLSAAEYSDGGAITFSGSYETDS